MTLFVINFDYVGARDCLLNRMTLCEQSLQNINIAILYFTKEDFVQHCYRNYSIRDYPVLVLMVA